MTESSAGLPSPDDRYTFEIRISRNPRDPADEGKRITSLTYHALNYGALVLVEKAVTDKLMPALTELGLQVAEDMGYAVQQPGE